MTKVSLLKPVSPTQNPLARFEVKSFPLSRSESVAPAYDESGRATPQINGVHMSSMNPAITFREKSLYTSNYFLVLVWRIEDLLIYIQKFTKLENWSGRVYTSYSSS